MLLFTISNLEWNRQNTFKYSVHSIFNLTRLAEHCHVNRVQHRLKLPDGFINHRKLMIGIGLSVDVFLVTITRKIAGSQWRQ